MNPESVFIAVIVLFSIVFGSFLIRFPLNAFELQRRFYRLINWDIKPISVEKEIRNTKWMGIFLIIVTLGICLFKWLHI